MAKTRIDDGIIRFYCDVHKCVVPREARTKDGSPSKNMLS